MGFCVFNESVTFYIGRSLAGKIINNQPFFYFRTLLQNQLIPLTKKNMKKVFWERNRPKGLTKCDIFTAFIAILSCKDMERASAIIDLAKRSKTAQKFVIALEDAEICYTHCHCPDCSYSLEFIRNFTIEGNYIQLLYLKSIVF